MIRKYPRVARLMTDEDGSNSKENNNLAAQSADSIWNPVALGLQVLDATDPRIEMSKVEGQMDPYEVIINHSVFK